MDNHLSQASENISISAMWQWEWLLYTIILAVIYFVVIGPLTKRFGDVNQPLIPLKKVSFLTGLLFIFFANGSPLSELAESYLFSAHMIKMAISFLIVPPLLLVGTPEWLVRKIVNIKMIGLPLKVLTKPLFALLLFNLVFSIYHVPTIFNVVTVHVEYHLIYHFVLLILAYCMWWPVTCPLPEWDNLSELKKMGYIFANGILLTPSCSLIIFSHSILYDTYVGVPQLFGFLPPIDDQQLGGVAMKIIQEIVYISALGYIFYRWMIKQRRQDEVESKPGYRHLEFPNETKV